MKINSKDFRVSAGKKVDLRKWPTRVKPIYKSKKNYHKLLESQVTALSALQRLHYASNRYAVLLILQGMDAAGKDGAIRHVMSRVNPQGCQVFSFKQPSAEELEHVFLWRATCRLPERGRIGVFNRSYYEEVLIVRVHPEILGGQGLPEALLDEKTIWKGRYRSIVDLEDHLHRNGTRIIKIFLHQSKDEQRKRFLKRIDNSEKNWKLSIADIEERKLWPDYMKAYEACLSATSTTNAPWHVVPTDDKKNAPTDYFRDRPRRVQGSQNGLSRTHRETQTRIAIDSQDVGEITKRFDLCQIRGFAPDEQSGGFTP